MVQHFLAYRSSTIAWYTGGEGPRTLFCLHGFGESGKQFAVLVKALSKHYTLYAIDLPHHGNTHWKEGNDFTLADLQTILAQILPPGKPYTLLGFSMGGRIALSLLQAAPQSTEALVLLAPDGLRMSPWYWIATQTKAGNLLFRFSMRHAGWLAGVVNVLFQLKIVNKSIAKFVRHHIDDATMREQLYRIWTTMRRFKPDMHAIRTQLAKHPVPVKMIFGKFDRIILTRYGKNWQQKMPQHITLYEFYTGHYLLKEKFAPHIAAILLGK